MTKDTNYSFTSIPTTMIYAMDNYCLKAMTLFIQEESYWKSKDKLENGFFYKPISEIAEVLFLKKEQDARRTIEALYRRNLIDVHANNGKRSTLKIRLNWDKIRELAQMSIRDIQLFENPIVKLSRDEALTYCQSDDAVSEDELEYKLEPNCPPTIDKINKINKIDKKKEEKEEKTTSQSSSLSSQSSSLSSEEQEQKPFKPDDNKEDSLQGTEDEEDEEWFDEVREYIRTNALRELRGETITKEDDNFQKSILMLMEYDNFKRRDAIDLYNEILHNYKDSFRKLPSLWRKKELCTAD